MSQASQFCQSEKRASSEIYREHDQIKRQASNKTFSNLVIPASFLSNNSAQDLKQSRASHETTSRSSVVPSFGQTSAYEQYYNSFSSNSFMAANEYFAGHNSTLSFHQPYAQFLGTHNPYSSHQHLQQAPNFSQLSYPSSNESYDVDPLCRSNTSQLKARSVYPKESTRPTPYSAGQMDAGRMSMKRHPSQSNDSCAFNESGYCTHSPTSIDLVLDSALAGHQESSC